MTHDNNASAATHYMNAEYRLTFNVNLEDGIDVFRSSTKKLASTNGDLRYYKYDVYCSEDILIGYMVQSILMKDMGPSTPLFRHGGLCSPLYLDLKNLHIEYRGHIVPIAEAQRIPIGVFLTNYRDSRSRLQRQIPRLSRSYYYKIDLVGTMSVGVYPPCCCTIPKLIWPELIPWKRYDVFKPEFDFSAPVMNSMMRDTDQNVQILDNNPNPNIAPAIPMVTADNVFIPSNHQGDSNLVLTATLVEDTCEDILVVEPEKKLSFTIDSYADKVSAILTLKHPGGNAYLSYKVKTTHPRRYLVRPNQGIVAPGTSETIDIVLVEKDKQDFLKTFDRLGTLYSTHFLVESCIIDEAFGKKYLEQYQKFVNDHSPDGAKASKDLSESLTAMWNKLRSGEDSRIFNHKLQARHVAPTLVEDTCENKNIKRDNTEHSKKVLYKTKPKGEKTKFALGVEPEKTLRFAMTRDSCADKVSAILTLTHSGRKTYLAYKIEITNPSRYLIGQKLGIVAPGTSEYINFVLVEKEKQKLLKTFDFLGEPVLDHSKGALVVDYCIIDESFGKKYIEEKQALATDHSSPAGAKASKDLNESLTIMWDKLSSEEDSRILSRKLRVKYVVTTSLENEHASKVTAEEQSDR